MPKKNKPYYPDQGSYISNTAQFSLLPADLAPERAKLLFIHAHPDDESTSTGATMAEYASRGAQVDLLTLTRGERGEVIPDIFAHLAAGHRDCFDRGHGLGQLRELELAEALEHLGVSHHLYLGQGVSAVPGAPAQYRDSGMVWDKQGRAQAHPDKDPDSLLAQDIERQAAGIAAFIKYLGSDVVVTYDHGGGYGHPDHVRTYEATLLAVRTCAQTSWEPRLVWGLEGESSSSDSRPQAVIDGPLTLKRDAMSAHVSQIMITGEDTFHYSNGVSQKISARETYRLLWAAEEKVQDRAA